MVRLGKELKQNYAFTEVDVFKSAARTPEDRSRALARDHVPSPEFGYAYYDAPNGTYHGYHYDGRYAEPAKRIVEMFGLTPGSRVLEVGCAKGFLLVEFHKLGMKVRGLEVSSYAVDNAHPDIRDRITLIEPGEWPAFWRKFDLVICKEVLPHIDLQWLGRKISYLNAVAKHQLIEIQTAESLEAADKMRAWDVTHRVCSPADWWRDLLDECGYAGVVSFKELFPS